LNLLILGLSNLVTRRVLPALNGLQDLARIDVATRTKSSEWARLQGMAGDLYDDYERALAASPADVVYVSLVNAEHGRWAEAAIALGKHVVVDKPAFLGLRQAERAVELAHQHGACLAEATVFAYHPQVAMARRMFHDAGCQPLRIAATFSFPPLDSRNFRYRRSLGGGALWDLGPYAVSVGRVFFGSQPQALHAQVTSRGGAEDVETGFSMLACYPGEKSVVGHFGFDTAYRNRVDILGATVGVEVDRIFTIAPDAPNTIRVTRQAETAAVEVPPADPFALFVQCVFERIAAGTWEPLMEDLLADARALEQLRAAAIPG